MDNIQTYQAYYEKVVSGQGENIALPHLVQQISNEPSWWQSFTNWLKSLFPQKVGVAGQVPWATILEWLLYVAITLLVIFIFYALFRALYTAFSKKQKNVKTTAQTSHSVVQTKVSDLENLYQQALAQKNYAQAARLFWKLQLQKKQLPPSMTLLEFYQLSDFQQNTPVIEQGNSLMFSQLQQSELVFKEWSQNIQNLSGAKLG